MRIHYFREKKVADREIKQANKILKNNKLNSDQEDRLKDILKDITNRKTQIEKYLSSTKRAKFFRFFNKKFGEGPKARIDDAILKINARLQPKTPPSNAPQTKPETRSEPESLPQSKTDEQTQPETHAEAEADAESQPEVETEPQDKLESQPEPEPQQEKIPESPLQELEAAMPNVKPIAVAKQEEDSESASVKPVSKNPQWEQLSALKEQLAGVRGPSLRVKLSEEFKTILQGPKNNLTLTSDSKLIVNKNGTTFDGDKELQEDLAAALEKEFIDTCELFMRATDLQGNELESLKKYLNICSEYIENPPISSNKGFLGRLFAKDYSSFSDRLGQGMVRMVQAYNLLFLLKEENITQLVKAEGGYFVQGQPNVREIKEEIAAFLREKSTSLSVAARLNLMMKYADCFHACEEEIPEDIEKAIYELAEAFCVYSLRVNEDKEKFNAIASQFNMAGLSKILSLRIQGVPKEEIPVPEKINVSLEDPLNAFRTRLDEAKKEYATDKSLLRGLVGKTFTEMPLEAFQKVKDDLEEVFKLPKPSSIREAEARMEFMENYLAFLTFKDLKVSENIKEECQLLAQRIQEMLNQGIDQANSLEELLQTSGRMFPKEVVERLSKNQFGEAITERIMKDYFGKVEDTLSRDKLKELRAAFYVYVHAEDLNDRALSLFRPQNLKESLNLPQKIEDPHGIFKALELIEAGSLWDDSNPVKKPFDEAYEELVQFANQTPPNPKQFHSDMYLNIAQLASNLSVVFEKIDEKLLLQIQARIVESSLSKTTQYGEFADEYVRHLTVLMRCIEERDLEGLKRHFTRHPLQSPLENSAFDGAYRALHDSEYLANNVANMPGGVTNLEGMLYTLIHEGRPVEFKVEKVVKANGLCCQILTPLNWDNGFGPVPIKMVFDGFSVSPHKIDRSIDITGILSRIATEYVMKGELKMPGKELIQQPGEAVWKDQKLDRILLTALEEVINKGEFGATFALEITGADLGGMDAQYAAAAIAPSIVGEGIFHQKIASMTVKTYNQWGIPVAVSDKFNNAFYQSRDKFAIYHSVTKDNEMQFVGATLLGNHLEGVPKVLEVGISQAGVKGSNWQKIQDAFKKVSSSYGSGQYQIASSFTPFRLWSSQRGAAGRYFRRFGFQDREGRQIGLQEKMVDLGMVTAGDVGMEVRSKFNKPNKSLQEQGIEAFFNLLMSPESPTKQSSEYLEGCVTKNSYGRMKKDEVARELEIRKNMTPRQVRNLLKYGLPKSATGALQGYLKGQVESSPIIQKEIS